MCWMRFQAAWLVWDADRFVFSAAVSRSTCGWTGTEEGQVLAVVVGSVELLFVGSVAAGVLFVLLMLLAGAGVLFVLLMLLAGAGVLFVLLMLLAGAGVLFVLLMLLAGAGVLLVSSGVGWRALEMASLLRSSFPELASEEAESSLESRLPASRLRILSLLVSNSGSDLVMGREKL